MLNIKKLLTKILTSFVKKTGDTMSGKLTVENYIDVKNARNITIYSDQNLGDARSSDYWNSYFQVYDKDNTQGGAVTGVSTIFGTDGASRVTLHATRKNGSGTRVANQLNLIQRADGTRSVNVSDSAAWRTAIGAVNKAGDTMTGVLNINMSSGDTYFVANRTDVGVKVGFGVGSGGTNHGVYSYKLSKWLVYGNASTVFVNGIQMDNTLFKYKSYSYAYTVAANSYVNVTGTNLGLSTPSGYTGMGTYKLWPGNSNCGVTLYDVNNTGGSTACQVRNFSGSERSGTLQVGVIYVRTGIISAI